MKKKKKSYKLVKERHKNENLSDKMKQTSKNYSELCIENYFLRKITQPYQSNFLKYSHKIL